MEAGVMTFVTHCTFVYRQQIFSIKLLYNSSLSYLVFYFIQNTGKIPHTNKGSMSFGYIVILECIRYFTVNKEKKVRLMCDGDDAIPLFHS